VVFSGPYFSLVRWWLALYANVRRPPSGSVICVRSPAALYVSVSERPPGSWISVALPAE
jgi:hypothetical protein